MTVGRISFVCWTVFVLMCVAFLPLAAAIDGITALPGRAPYETTCSLCARGLAAGQTVEVAVARHNPRRVTIVPGLTAWPQAPDPAVLPAGVFADPYAGPARPPSRRERLIEELTRLG